MQYRHYTQKDETAVVELWNRCCVFDALNAAKFRRQAILDDNFDAELSWLAIDEESDNKLVGFIYGTHRKFPYLERGLEPEKGWINVMFVDASYRGRGIGGALLSKCEDALCALGVKEIILGAYSPNYFFWGVDTGNYREAVQFFEDKGYVEVSEHYSMCKDLHGYQIPEAIEKKKREAEKAGYRFIPFDYSYTLDLLEFLRDEFGGGWKRNALQAMQKGIAEDVLIIAIDKDNNICGCCNRAIDGNPMRFGPIGIAKAHRNAGIGTVLLDYALYEMSKKGIYHMFFVTTDEPGRRYYERQGLKVFRTFSEYRKEI